VQSASTMRLPATTSGECLMDFSLRMSVNNSGFDNTAIFTVPGKFSANGNGR
jgi:hypothetical protein